MFNVSQNTDKQRRIFKARVFMKIKYYRQSLTDTVLGFQHHRASQQSLDTVNKSTESSKYLALLLQLNFTVNFREQSRVFYTIVESGRIAVEQGRSSVNRGVSLTVTGQSRARTETERTSELRRFRHGPRLKSRIIHSLPIIKRVNRGRFGQITKTRSNSSMNASEMKLVFVNMT